MELEVAYRMRKALERLTVKLKRDWRARAKCPVKSGGRQQG
jgi:hypothetical protein